MRGISTIHVDACTITCPFGRKDTHGALESSAVRHDTIAPSHYHGAERLQRLEFVEASDEGLRSFP